MRRALLIIIGRLDGAVWRGWRLRPSCRARRQRRRCQRQRYAPCRRPCAARRPTSSRPAGCAPDENAAQRKREGGGGERAKKTTRFARRARISRRNKLAVIRAATAGQSVTIVLLLLITLKGLSPQGKGVSRVVVPHSSSRRRDHDSRCGTRRASCGAPLAGNTCSVRHAARSGSRRAPRRCC
jgi:hypothetical protein